MTAEIAIMNKAGIALAADSAVSIETPSGLKVYNSNKLFMLSKHHPVGIMVYGNADIMDVPWESIIKNYRKELRDKSFKLLEDYGTDFLAFLDKNLFLFPHKQQEDEVFVRTLGYLSHIADIIIGSIERITHKGVKITRTRIEQVVSSVIGKTLDFFVSLPRVTSLPPDFEKHFLREYRIEIDQAIDNAFLKLPLSASDRKRLGRICIGLFVKDTSPYSPTSGIVIAGFGESELFPALVSYQIDCVVNNRLKYTEFGKARIDHHTIASVLPFAQGEMVETFMEGVSPVRKEALRFYLESLFDKYPEKLIGAFTHLSPSARAKLLAEMKAEGVTLAKEFLESIETWAQENITDQITSTVAVLPIEDLASMAESLVNLTSFKRRMTLVEDESVSGPIDVALISKGDGFIWIKRKHYFDADKNPHFFKNYYR
jgi:hypothetical protein